MICLNYVKNGVKREDVFTPFLAYTESCKNIFDLPDISKSVAVLEYELTGEMNAEAKTFLESENKGFFEKIGDAIIGIFQKFINMINNAIDKVKEYSFSSKSYAQKMEILIKEHPDLKDEVIMACNKGALDLNDMKSLNEMNKTFDEVLKMAKKENVDPNTIRGKLTKAIDDFKESDSKKWTVVKVAGATSAVITAYVAARTLKSKIADADKCYRDTKRESERQKQEILDYIKYRESKGDQLTVDEKAAMQAILSCNTSRLAEITRSMNHMDNFVGDLSEKLGSFIEKHHNAKVARDFNRTEGRSDIYHSFNAYRDEQKKKDKK